MFLKTAFNHDTDAESRRAGLKFVRPSRCKQEFKEEVNINTIVRRFGLDGKLPQGVRMPTYGDFSQVGDFRTALEAIRSAEASFMALPARVRARFENDPAQFVAFCSDKANLSEARELGLVPPEEVAPTPPVAVPAAA